ncbi:MAG: hypothetical protein ACK40G_04825 [Cytophagaceae bacterium]
MDIKVDLLKIESYSTALSERLCNEYFSANNQIDGKKIITFCSVDQVNYFILMNLMDKWGSENEKLKSPYFNFDADEVKQALKKFMNELSNHILVKQEFFKPLLRLAIMDTLILSLDPQNFLKTFIGERLNEGKQLLSEKAKFFRINKEMYQKAIEKIGTEQDLDLVDTLSDLREDPSEIVNKFSVLSRVEIGELIIPHSPIIIEDTPGKEESISKMPPEPVQVNALIPPPSEEKIIEKQGKNQAGNQTLNDVFEKRQLTLNELLKQAERPTIAEQMARSKIVSIKSAITLNQKFTFINSLFSGMPSEFELAVTEIESCQTFDNAKDLIQEKFIIKFNWNLEKPEVREFLEIVERKFS